MLTINIIIYGLGAHILFSIVCPNEYQITLINLSFYVILIYSYIELFFKNMYNYPGFSRIRTILNKIKKNGEIEIIKFNDVLVSTNKKSLYIHNFLLYDFIIFSDYERLENKCTEKVNKILYYDLQKFPINFTYEVCNFSFISISVKIIKNEKEEVFPLKLSSHSENYYVVGNKINRLLVCYLLKKQHKILCDEISEKYKLEIIDNNVNMLTFTEDDEIILNVSDYIVNKFDFIDTSNMTVAEIVNISNNTPQINDIAESKNENIIENVNDNIADSMQE